MATDNIQKTKEDLAAIQKNKIEFESKLTQANEKLNLFKQKLISKFGLSRIEELDEKIQTSKTRNEIDDELFGSSDVNEDVVKSNIKFEELKNAQIELFRMESEIIGIKIKLQEAQKEESVLNQQIQELEGKEKQAQQRIKPTAPLQSTTSPSERPAIVAAQPSVEMPNDILNKIQKILGKDYKIQGDVTKNIIMQNDSANPPQGFQITNNKIQPLFKNPLTQSTCETMLKLAKELYGNELVLFAASEKDQDIMKAVAGKLGVKYQLVTTKEEFDKKIAELQQKKEEPKQGGAPEVPTPTASNPNTGTAPDATDPNKGPAPQSPAQQGWQQSSKGGEGIARSHDGLLATDYRLHR